jgi:inhibitor of the pro-sigma K processing machinery
MGEAYLMTFIIVWAASAAVIALVMTARISKCKRPLLMAAKSSLSGIASMMLVNVLASFTGVSLSVNYVTVSCAVLLGAPGAVLMLVTQAISGL